MGKVLPFNSPKPEEQILLYCSKCKLVTQLEKNEGSICPVCHEGKHLKHVKLSDFVKAK